MAALAGFQETWQGHATQRCDDTCGTCSFQRRSSRCFNFLKACLNETKLLWNIVSSTGDHTCLPQWVPMHEGQRSKKNWPKRWREWSAGSPERHLKTCEKDMDTKSSYWRNQIRASGCATHGLQCHVRGALVISQGLILFPCALFNHNCVFSPNICLNIVLTTVWPQ